MISQSKKQTNDIESDSDWDSLPGDITAPGSSPEPKSSSLQNPVQSPRLNPAPPKQPHSKHPTTPKPINMYKNTSNPIRNTGGATTFEDQTGGLYDDDNVKVTFLKDNNSNVMKNNEMRKERQDSGRKRNALQGHEKRPPYTDFREALDSPISTTMDARGKPSMAGVNQAYRMEPEDEIQTIRDSWDDSENESENQQTQNKSGKEVRTMKQEKLKGRDSKHSHQRENTEELETIVNYHENHPFRTNQNFENCCLIQVAEGAFDDRNRPSFFHGSRNHFHVREDDPRAAITDIVEKSEVIVQRFWREIFGVLQIFINFFIIFILELFKTVILSLRYLLTGILYTTGDHFIKPLLSALFNNIIQPFSILLLNVFTILMNLLKPVLGLTREILSQVAIPLRALRLFALNKGKDEDLCTDVKIV